MEPSSSSSPSSSDSTTAKFPLPESFSFNHSFSFNSDRRFSFSRNSSFRHQFSDLQPAISIQRMNSLTRPRQPNLLRSDSSINIDDISYDNKTFNGIGVDSLDAEKERNFLRFWSLIAFVVREARFGNNRSMKRLAFLISLNVAYSTTELFTGLITGRVGLVSDAFHLTFGCGLLTFSLFAMAVSRSKPDGIYTYGYKRLEVLAAFTNALFLVFMAFSLAVEALHAFIQDESEHRHYLIISAVTNLLVNLVGVWFFRNYARINIVYSKAEDMNNHSVCLHVLADSIRSAGLILASWLLSMGIENAETLCLGLVSVTVLVVTRPLFQATGSILLQMAPPGVPHSALSKCHRQISALEDVSEVSQARFWELVPGRTIGSVSVQVKRGVDVHPILRYVHDLYHELGIQELTIQIDCL